MRSITNTVFGLPVMLALALTVSCAKQSAPTGGQKDEDPPVVVSSVPAQGTVNFKGEKISVTFNEYIVFDKLNDKFMVSPPLKTKPEITLRGKTMMITFREALRDSSTYTLYFQDAIRDLNENNPFNNFQFVFSTGPVLDSLSVTGNVFSLPDLEASGNSLVLLHRTLSDTAPRKSLPDYITLTDKNGVFRIDNISQGRYRLYALSDNNGNKKYDLEDEKFAFSDTIISVLPESNYLPVVKDTTPKAKRDSVIINRSEAMYNLFLTAAPPKKHYLKSSERKPGNRLFFALSLPAGESEFSFALPDTISRNYIETLSRNRDTMTVWLRDSLSISYTTLNAFLTYPFTDSAGKKISRRDTIPLRFTTPRLPKGSKVKKTPLEVSVNIRNNSIRTGQRIRFDMPTPFGSADTSKILLFELAGKERLRKKLVIQPDSLTTGRLFLKTSLKDESKYLLLTDRGAFSDIYGQKNDSTGVTFTVQPKTAYGHLEFNITGVESPVIVQLLDSKENVVAERFMKENGRAVYDLLDRGTYRARAISDLNGDGRWTTGDFDSNNQPEPVAYYPNEVEVKIDWVIEQPWEITEWNFKNEKLRQQPLK
jgi:uncharacterized protein (DUF2141 family)